MNYSIVRDEAAFRIFIDWLPELQENEKYYLSLFARRKYSEVVTTDKANLKRFATDKKRMLEKVRQLECAEGTYIAKEVAVPAEALALYISVNPRCAVRASFQTIIALTESLQHVVPPGLLSPKGGTTKTPGKSGQRLRDCENASFAERKATM